MGLDIFGTILLLFGVYAIAGAGAYIAERAGIINLGINGGMIIGAMAYCLVVFSINNKNAAGIEAAETIPAFILGVVLGALFTMLGAVAIIHFRSNHVVVGTALNIIAPAISLLVIVLLSDGQNTIQMTNGQLTSVTGAIPAWATRLIIGFCGLLIVGIIWFFVRFTSFGLRIRASGENPFALQASGVSVFKIRYLALLISGFLAGLAGAMLASAYDRLSAYNNNVLGIGYIAIAILIIGQWQLPWVVTGSLVLAILYAVTDRYGVDLGSDKWLLNTVPYILAIVSMPFFSRFSRAPKYDGIVIPNL